MIQSIRLSGVRWSFVLGVLFAFIGLTGCGEDAASSGTLANPASEISPPTGVNSTGAPVILDVVDGGETTGLIITDHRGFAVYGVIGETVDNLVCVAECTTAWIPLTADGRTATADRLDAGRLGSVVRPDGITQVTYAAVPLYLWTGDNTAGVTRGAGVAGIWFALTETGGFID